MSIKKGQKAFTLIELIIVIAILGLLAVLILSAINPSEKLAQSRDTGRISTISQLGKALEDYYVSGGNEYPSEATWDTDLVSTGHPNVFPGGIEYSSGSGVTACTTNAKPDTESTYCYDLDTSINDYGALVFAKLEAKNKTEQCSIIGDTYFVYSTEDKRAGTICSNGDPSPWAAGTQNYFD